MIVTLRAYILLQSAPMSNKSKQFISQFLPYIFVGVRLAVFVARAIILSYVLIWGLIVGTILFIIAAIKNKFFNKKPAANDPEQPQGRIIEHDEL